MITNLNKQNAQDIIQNSSKPVIIDVFATWCGPCIQMKPYFEELADELSDKYVFAELNVDESREVAISLNVTSVPTFIFIKNKAIVGREVGYMPKEDLQAKIEGFLGSSL